MTDAWIPAKDHFSVLSRGPRTKAKDRVRVKLLLAMASEENTNLRKQIEELKKQVSES